MDYIEQKKREYMKSEACDWDAHDYCDSTARIVESRKDPCLCNCHNTTISGRTIIPPELQNIPRG